MKHMATSPSQSVQCRYATNAELARSTWQLTAQSSSPFSLPLSFLPLPTRITDSHSFLNTARAHTQGWRVDMEDAHTITLPIESSPEYSWFAVYDGHGGSLVSTESAKAVLGKITGSAEWRADHRSLDSIRAAMKRGFLEMDEDLRKVRANERARRPAGR